MTPYKVSGRGEITTSGCLDWASLALGDCAIALWLWHALQRFTVGPGSLMPGILLPALETPVLALALGLHRFHRGRPFLMLLKAVALAATIGGLGSLAASRGWLGISWREALWLGGATGTLVWLFRSVYFGTAAARAGQPLEVLRWISVGLVGTVVMLPFYHNGALGAGDAHWYGIMLGDFVTQLRAGVFPVWVGQSIYAFNGAVSPLRYAPGFQHLGGLLDFLTMQSLDPTTLRNVVLAVTSVLGAFSAYACLRSILSRAPWIACLLAMLWVSGPGVLAPVMTGDQYMTFLTIPFVPLVLHGCWRVWRFDDRWGRLWIVVGLAGMWIFHSPIALWFSFISAGIYLGGLVRVLPWRRGLAAGALMAAAFLVLGSLPFISVLTLDNQIKPESSGAVAAEVVHNSFPDNFRPIDPTAPGLAQYQLGFALLGTLLVTLRLMVVSRPRGAWAFALASVLVIPFTLPVPWLTTALWSHAPAWFVAVQNIWPQQRLFLVWSALIVFTAAIVMGSPEVVGRSWLRVSLALALLCGLAWSGREAFRLEHGVFIRRSSAKQSLLADGPDNLLLSRYAYSSYTYSPSYFSHAYMDPWFENRLLDVHTMAPFRYNGDAAAPVAGDPGAPSAGARLVGSGTWVGHSLGHSEYYRLKPDIPLEAGRRYAMRIDFLQPGIEGTLQFYSQSMFREYMLPDSGSGVARGGPGLAFGADEGNSHVISFSVDGKDPEPPVGMFVARAYGKETLPFARYWLYTYDRDRLPIRIKSWIPYRVQVDSPHAAYLETPRMYLKGWKARVNGRRVETLRSPENLEMIPVGAGESEVSLEYSPPAVLLLSFWTCAAAWSALGALGLLQLFLWTGGERLAYGWLGPPRTPAWLTKLGDAAALSVRAVWRQKLLRAALVLVVAALVYLRVRESRKEAYLGAVGPIRVEFTRPHGLYGFNQPLLTTGRPGAGTIVFIYYQDVNHVKMGADVWGTLLESGPLEMDYGRVQSIVVSDSALYPLGHPKIQALERSEAEHLRSELRVELNGRVVIQSPCYAYETTPSEILAGKTTFGSLTDRKFMGEILGVEHLPIPRTIGVPTSRHVHMRVRFPKGRVGASEPLVSVSSGASRRVCFVTYLSEQKLRLTCWGPDGVPPKSAEFTYEPELPHDLDFHPGESSEGAASFDVACYFDGEHLIGHNPVAVAEPPVIVSSLNEFDAPGVDARFTGPQMDVSLDSNSARADLVETVGPEHLVVRFPLQRTGRQEPLVTTGRTGAGDFIYIIYQDAGHVRIGFDHWGVGGKTSGPVAVDYSVPHEFWISTGALYPDVADDTAWRGLDPALRARLKSRVIVMLDGQTVLTDDSPTHPSKPEEVAVATNPIGGSTCDPLFTGAVVFLERAGPVAPPSGNF